jgi:hypothetical protein
MSKNYIGILNKVLFLPKYINMKKYLLFFALNFIAFCCFSQVVKAEDAAKHIGETVKVCGKVFGGKFFETSDKAPTLLNVGAPFPNSPFTIMIPKEVRLKMGTQPEIELKDKNVCVTGKIILFKEKPEIVISDATQLTVEKE